MRKILLPMFCILAVISSGCVATTLKHEIAIVRDADGKIIQTIETEGIEQPGAANTGKIQFKTLQLPK